MPYNTRRKSLSLPSLGIHLPNASRAHRSNSKSSSPSETPQQPPAKRIKRSHDENEPPSPLSSPRPLPISDVATKLPRRAAEHTPPPSPGDITIPRKVDTEGINDDIVIGVIEQLEKTGNRPHLIKDLATVLASTNDSIAHSANPAALLSSRLSLYLKRPWTALSPCPLAKELIPVHPRKVFFFLTTQPRMPLPQNSNDIIAPSLGEIKRLTPSISDPSIEDEAELDLQDRSRMSPSPEVELFSPELDHGSPTPPTPGENFSGRSSLNPDGTTEVRRRLNRAPSPPLEADEKGFTETATAVRARGTTMLSPIHPSVEISKVEIIEDTPEMRYKRDQELGLELFGQSHPGLQVVEQKMLASSPMIHPRQKLHLDLDIEMGDASWSMMSPESIEVDELDTLFTDF